jgi:hypothetical protein
MLGQGVTLSRALAVEVAAARAHTADVWEARGGAVHARTQQLGWLRQPLAEGPSWGGLFLVQ